MLERSEVYSENFFGIEDRAEVIGNTIESDWGSIKSDFDW